LVAILDRALTSAAVASVFVQTSLLAQNPRPIRIPDAVSCSVCEIRLHGEMVLRVPRDTADGFPTRVKEDGQGRIWVLSNGELPTLFGPDGRFLRRLGTFGRGPGEFVAPHDILFAQGDSAVVLDGVGARATVLGPTLALGRTIVLPLQLLGATILAWPDTVIGSGSIQTTAEFGWPLHRVSFRERNAVAFKSFGGADGLMTPANSMQAWYWTARSDPAAFWAVWSYGYDLAEWTTAGRQLRAMERRPSWFREPSPPTAGSRVMPPPPHIAGIQRDSTGLLWVYVRVAAPTWKQAWPAMPPGVREVPSSRLAKDLLFSTIVEVIDPAARRVVARHRFERYFVGGLDAGRVAFYQVPDKLGEGLLSVARIQLDRR
jgi:hypothetical protein